jgi:hypothetical protein
MRVKRELILAVILGLPASGATAQSAVPPAPQAAAEPVLLTLPMGSRVRMQTMAASGGWIKGILVSADSASVALVPENAPPLGANQLRVPSASVARFELATGKKRHWLPGLVIGAALGLALGATSDVDPVACEFDYNYECSRGEALALYGVSLAAVGAGIGALVKTDRWTPVALDALAPPPPRVSGIAPQLRALPGGGVGLGIAVGF